MGGVSSIIMTAWRPTLLNYYQPSCTASHWSLVTAQPFNVVPDSSENSTYHSCIIIHQLPIILRITSSWFRWQRHSLIFGGQVVVLFNPHLHCFSVLISANIKLGEFEIFLASWWSQIPGGRWIDVSCSGLVVLPYSNMSPAIRDCPWALSEKKLKMSQRLRISRLWACCCHVIHGGLYNGPEKILIIRAFLKLLYRNIRLQLEGGASVKPQGNTDCCAI